MAAIQTLGALKTILSNLLNTHVGFLPINIRVQKVCMKATAQIAALPKTHLLHKPARQAATFVKHHYSSLHYIMKALGEDLKMVETIEVVRKGPGWRCLAKVAIDPMVEEAMERERNNETNTRIYTNGSGQKGMIGAAVVLYRGFNHPKVARKCLRKEEDHIVFEGECIGQVLVLELLRVELKSRRVTRMVASISIGTDNQAGICAVEDPGPGTGQYLINEVLNGIQRIRRIGSKVDIEIQWTLGHQGIAGNERADREAKRAVEGNKINMGGTQFLQKPLPKSKAAIIARHKKVWCSTAQTKLRASPRFEKAKAIDLDFPNTARITSTLLSLPCKHASLLVQLCMGHCPLNTYLCCIQKVNSPLCTACSEAPKIVNHYLLDCRTHSKHQCSLHRVICPGPNALSTLLSDLNAIEAEITYIHVTRQFERSFGDLLRPAEMRDTQ
ncbi:hypothetical protein J132_05095 [Termitomyces sp. J132]|nr:hypothetical protein J132_05095 [Termitomyces sp. J132]